MDGLARDPKDDRWASSQPCSRTTPSHRCSMYVRSWYTEELPPTRSSGSDLEAEAYMIPASRLTRLHLHPQPRRGPCIVDRQARRPRWVGRA